MKLIYQWSLAEKRDLEYILSMYSKLILILQCKHLLIGFNYLLQGFGGDIDLRFMLGMEAIPSVFFLLSLFPRKISNVKLNKP